MPEDVYPRISKKLLRFNVSINTAQINQVLHEGKTFVVAPVVILTEGVHNGSAGSILHTATELQKHVQTWNDVPLVVMHPSDDEGGISACSPQVLEDSGVGRLYNVEYRAENPALIAELWIDRDKANRISPQTLQELYAGKLEVSTGMFHDINEMPGEFNGEKYEGVAIDYRPDHLALLPGEVGACSWDDGCGAPRTNQENIPELFKRLAQYKLSFRDIGQKLQVLIDGLDGDKAFHYIEEIYDNEFIYTRSKEGEGETHYRRAYMKEEDDNIVLGEKITEVKREIKWVPIDGPNNNQGEVMTKEERIKALIDCSLNSYTEEDVPILNEFSEEQLEMLERFLPEGEPNTNQQQEPCGDGDNISTNQQDVSIGQPVQQTMNVNDYLQHMPDEMAEMIRDNLDEAAQRKEQLVQHIGQSQGNAFSTEELRAMNIKQLKKIAALIPTPVDYSLQGGPEPVNNEPEIEHMYEPPNIYDGGLQ